MKENQLNSRRSFIKKTAVLSSALSFGSLGLKAMNNTSGKIESKPSFNLNYAPHIGMFKNHAGENPLDEINFMAEQGFTAFEDNEMRNRPIELQNKIGNLLVDKNMKMGVFVAHKIYWDKPNLTSGAISYREEFLEDIKKSVEVAKRVNATWMTVVPGHLDLNQNINYQTANVVESLKYASEILEKNNLIMVLEPLNFYNHPGLFLTESPQAYQICKSVNSPSCKILFDIYHQQVQEGNLIPNIEKSWDEIAYFQIGDNPGRNEPTTGEINFKNIFKFIHSKGFNGILGMEHGNSLEGKEGEQAVINAYLKSDNFLN
ncbi:hydroxypyruvate isomerase [Lutibacter oceani]|uniref:Hydroxypyruvate isomerase n=1 Tax=Lutibacter oceani TaxID=1853311 RepID=A0A3D9RTU8_9FLAO|nr:TIM barrel protein [Lutibacter oceani]REE83380.1 hydroxypyruvate isomerase [Lutibacter oceani]